jgi:hypothetical protein
MLLITALSLFALIAAIGGLLLALIAFIRIAFWRFRPRPLFANRSELWTLSASLAIAILGSVLLFVVPVYSGVTHTISISSGGTVAQVVAESSRSFYEVNDPKVIPLFTVPISFALLPFGFFRSRTRPIIQGLCAFLLGGLAAIGMSGYGLFYAPSGAIMLLSGVLALRGHATQPNDPTDAAS